MVYHACDVPRAVDLRDSPGAHWDDRRARSFPRARRRPRMGDARAWSRQCRSRPQPGCSDPGFHFSPIRRIQVSLAA